ncbi:TetR/AcrR family transcriptional regulator [Chelativorans sp. YIM 93263]|uniref:TetR/AcrR family transcriptional regulator n=1 Tax=Chelativorans sp. YIM 93263 TaxID=2906648 RepID=UPI002378330D|nr:TetR/AcrR family transcriptional regulator [Chelativorans sp. YIM 93263]
MSILRTTEKARGDPKRERILEGAKQVFLTYGYSRTTMDDIARATEISRPALYLQFRNKADIFRAVGQVFLDESLAGALEALREDAPLGNRLIKALDRGLFQLFHIIEDSPHGDELVDVENQIAADIVSAWRENLVEAFTQAIAEEAGRRGIQLEDRNLSAPLLADMLFGILDGLKLRGLCGTHARDYSCKFVTLIELALARG